MATNLGDLLGRFKNVRPPNESKRLAVARALKEVLNIEIPIEKISIRGTQATVNVSHSDKAAMYISKTELLEHIQAQVAGETIKEIG